MSVMLHGEDVGVAAAQKADHMGGTRLKRIELAKVHPECAQVAAALRRHLIGVLKGEPLIVHQMTHQLRRSQRVIVCAETFAHPKSWQSTGLAQGSRGRNGSRGLKVSLCNLGAVRGAEQRSQLRIPARRYPDFVFPQSQNLPPSFVDDRKLIVLCPTFPIASTKPDRIDFLVYSIHMYSLAYSCADSSKPKSASMALRIKPFMTVSFL